MYTSVHSSIIQNSPKVETIHVSINNEWISQMWSVYPGNGIVFSSTKSGTTCTWYNLDEPHKYYAK